MDEFLLTMIWLIALALGAIISGSIITIYHRHKHRNEETRE
jgi:hypothetical protein